MEPDLEVSRDIAASPEAIFAVISDIHRLAELSPENVSNEWHEGFDSAEVGAMWTGQNRNGENEWSTQSRVTEMIPGESFVFECLVRDFVFAHWGLPDRTDRSGLSSHRKHPRSAARRGP